jgi:hypothetical protein
MLTSLAWCFALQFISSATQDKIADWHLLLLSLTANLSPSLLFLSTFHHRPHYSLGIANGGGVGVGSGGWNNIVEKYLKAKTYCEHPFETRHEGGRKIVVPIKGEWIGDRRNGKGPNARWTLVETV